MNKDDTIRIYIFALAAAGQGISGGDRIFIELARCWSKNILVIIHVWEEGYQMCQRQHLDSDVKFLISKMDPWRKIGFAVNYFARIFEGIRIGLTLKLENSPNIIIYSASEFWMDSFPAFILKLRYPKLVWVACWFQTAPLPWKGFAEGERKERFYSRSLIYWLIQRPMKPLVANFADLILVNNEMERKVFPKKDKLGKVMTILGGIDLNKIKFWRAKLGKLPKIYDACFQGRFHPQKGVLELIDIWKLVVSNLPSAKLVMIGDGPLMKNVKFKIQIEKLENNIILTGYLFDGEEKYKIFTQSKVVVHSSFYDSGGMAAAEAMAFSLPAIGFDLKSFRSYYPKGMIKVKTGDLKSFADEIVKLLSDNRLRERMGEEAKDMLEFFWSWNVKANAILQKII